jgi:hypothetical protein
MPLKRRTAFSIWTAYLLVLLKCKLLMKRRIRE